MKALPPALQTHLDSGTTTLAWCWRLTRNDGTAFGFTDHDRDLVFDGTTFEAATGFTASEIKDSLGLSVDNLEVSSALKSDHLSEDDLAAGLYDDAQVEIWRVNWADTAQRVLMRAGSLGEVRRAGASFAAEVRGLAHYLQQPKGAASTSPAATPTSAMPAAASTSTTLLSAAPAPSSPRRASGSSPPPVSTPTTPAGSHAASSLSPPASTPAARRK